MNKVVKVRRNENDYILMPLESDNSLLMSTLQSQYPNANGLKFFDGMLNEFVGIRFYDGKFYSAFGVWPNEMFCVEKTGKKRSIKEILQDEKEEHALQNIQLRKTLIEFGHIEKEFLRKCKNINDIMLPYEEKLTRVKYLKEVLPCLEDSQEFEKCKRAMKYSKKYGFLLDEEASVASPTSQDHPINITTPGSSLEKNVETSSQQEAQNFALDKYAVIDYSKESELPTEGSSLDETSSQQEAQNSALDKYAVIDYSKESELPTEGPSLDKTVETSSQQEAQNPALDKYAVIDYSKESELPTEGSSLDETSSQQEAQNFALDKYAVIDYSKESELPTEGPSLDKTVETSSQQEAQNPALDKYAVKP